MNFSNLLRELQEIDENNTVTAWHVIYDGHEISIKLELKDSYFNFLEEN